MFNSHRGFKVLQDDGRHTKELYNESRKHARNGKRLYDEGKQCSLGEASSLFLDAANEFSIAIQIYQMPSFYSSRAQCFLELAEYLKVVTDCEEALNLLDSDNKIDIVKNLLRKGKALHGLQRFAEALSVLEQANRMLPGEPEILEEIDLLKMRVPKKNETASVNNYSAVASKPPSLPAPRTFKDPYEDPDNPLRAVTIWVGNFQGRKATNTTFLNLFKKYGPVKTYIVIPSKNYGIVTLQDWKKAASAMSELQNLVFDGVMLKLKFRIENQTNSVDNRPATVSMDTTKSLRSSASPSDGILSTSPALSMDNESVKSNPGNAIWVGFGNLPDNFTPIEFRNIFASCGTIKSCSLLSKSACGFINFANPDSVAFAIKNFNGKIYKNCKLRVESKVEPAVGRENVLELDEEHSEYGSSISEDMYALWVGNLFDVDLKKEHLMAVFKAYNPSSVHLLRSHCAFVNFRKREDAERALANCNGAAVGPNKCRIIVEAKWNK